MIDRDWDQRDDIHRIRIEGGYQPRFGGSAPNNPPSGGSGGKRPEKSLTPFLGSMTTRMARDLQGINSNLQSNADVLGETGDIENRDLLNELVDRSRQLAIDLLQLAAKMEKA